MFTGLVEEMGTVVKLEQSGIDARLTVRGNRVHEDVTLGASIAINGCCLTVVEISDTELLFEAGSETLSRTNLGTLTAGSRVNLERALRVGDRLGGHYVTGHIDGLGRLVENRREGPWAHLTFSAPSALCRQMASKGSIAVDGVSLTLVQVHNESFSVALVPHTLSVTTLGELDTRGTVNLETDVLAKYVEAQLRGHAEATATR